MLEINVIQKLALWALPLLFAITLHEAARGFAAYKLGDSTPRQEGRLTINPLNHIDLIGTLVVPLLLIALGSPFLFGWAKPMPINWRHFKHPKRDLALVAIAGLLANVGMIFFWLLILTLGVMTYSMSTAMSFLVYTGKIGITINIILMLINLLPILPLAGGHIVFALLPPRLAEQFARLEPYAFLIILVIFATGILHYIFAPILSFVDIFLQWWLSSIIAPLIT